MRTLLLMISILLPVFGQGLRPRPVEPIRVTITTPDDETNAEIDRAIQGELRKLRDVIITERNADFELQLNGMRAASGGCRGYAFAVLILERKSGRMALQAHIGATPQVVATHMVEIANEEHFEPLRARTAKK